MATNELSIRFVSVAEILSAAIALPVLGILLVALRFVARVSRKRQPGADDYLILAALVRTFTQEFSSFRPDTVSRS